MYNFMRYGNDQNSKSQKDSPDHSDELMKCFVDVHGRVLRARLDVRDLRRGGRGVFRSRAFAVFPI